MGVEAGVELLKPYARSLKEGVHYTGFELVRHLRNGSRELPMLSPVLSSVSSLQAVEQNILEWVSLLHMRTPLCTVVLVASHFDMLRGTPEENEQLLSSVQQR